MVMEFRILVTFFGIMIEDDWQRTKGVFPGADNALDLDLYGIWVGWSHKNLLSCALYCIYSAFLIYVYYISIQNYQKENPSISSTIDSNHFKT